MSNMSRIIQFARRLETTITLGGCPVDRLFMTDTLSYSDIYLVPMGKEIEALAAAADCVHKLKIEVTMRRARYDYESKWRWTPDQYATGMLMFYHTDFDKLLEFVADYLEAHVDTATEPYETWKGNESRKPTFVKCLKHPPIGRTIHISEDPDLANYR